MNLSENYLTVVLPFSHGFDEGEDAASHGLCCDDVHRDVHQDVYQDVHQDVTQERTNTIIGWIKENPKIRQQDIASRVGVTVKTIYRQMRGMKEFIYAGTGRNGHWKIADEQGADENRRGKWK